VSGYKHYDVVKKRCRIAFVGLAVVMLAITVWLALHPHEPVYQGKRLSTWLEEIRTHADSPEKQMAAVKALQHFGTRAIPYLLNAIYAQDSVLKDKVVDWINDKFNMELGVRPAMLLQGDATTGFFVLGDVAEPAVPPLVRALTDRDYEIAYSATKALWAIGTTNCVSGLVQALTNSDGRIQDWAARWLANMHSKASAAMPTLLARLKYSDPGVREASIYAPGNIGTEPQIIVPALIRRLADPAPKVCACVAECLGALGSEASSATTALLDAEQHSDRNVREAAMRSLVRIQCEMRDGGIIRGPKGSRKIAFAFTGHEFAEGGNTILNELEKHRAKASFFLTGAFVAKERFAGLIRRMTNNFHYLGPHSDKHLLYCSWDNRKKTLVTRAEFALDLEANLKKLGRFGLRRDKMHYFLPAFEHYNREIADWSRTWKLALINFTPGTRSNADYTGEGDKNFVSSQAIFDSIVKKEREDPHGLNGFILLLHLGSGPGRMDKFHYRFGELLDYLAEKGYKLVRVDELLEPKETE